MLPYRESYAVFLYDLKQAALRAAKKLGIGGIHDVYRVSALSCSHLQMLYEEKVSAAERSKIKRMIYKPLKGSVSRSYFCSFLREGLLQDEFRFDDVSKDEAERLVQWVLFYGFPLIARLL